MERQGTKFKRHRGECWRMLENYAPREFCGINTSKNKLAGRNRRGEVAACANKTRIEGTSKKVEEYKGSAYNNIDVCSRR